jgi:hypothetical protein
MYCALIADILYVFCILLQVRGGKLLINGVAEEEEFVLEPLAYELAPMVIIFCGDGALFIDFGIWQHG